MPPLEEPLDGVAPPEPLEPEPLEHEPLETEPLDALPEPDELEVDADGEELVPVVEVVLVDVLDAGVDAAATPELGTVSGGAPDVSAEADPPPPQAARPADSAMPAPSAVAAVSTRRMPEVRPT